MSLIALFHFYSLTHDIQVNYSALGLVIDLTTIKPLWTLKEGIRVKHNSSNNMAELIQAAATET